MHGSDSKLSLHLLNKSQTPNRDRFRSLIVSSCQAVLQPLLVPFPVGSLKMFQIYKAAHLAQAP
jgi:hypothetical protein